MSTCPGSIDSAKLNNKHRKLVLDINQSDKGAKCGCYWHFINCPLLNYRTQF